MSSEKYDYHNNRNISLIMMMMMKTSLKHNDPNNRSWLSRRAYEKHTELVLQLFTKLRKRQYCINLRNKLIDVFK